MPGLSVPVLVVYMLLLLPSRGPLDIDFRFASAEAIVAVTADPAEQMTLAKIQKEESGYRRRIARCECKEHECDHGKSKGAWQLQPITSDDAKAACSSDLADQARTALAYLHRSADVCAKQKGVAKYNLYMSGKCDYGTRQAEARIVLDPAAEAARVFLPEALISVVSPTSD